MKYSLAFRFFRLPISDRKRFMVVASIWVLTMLSAGKAHAQEDALPVATFTREMDVPFVKVSPNGKRLATAILQGADNELCVLNTDSLSVIPLKFSLKDVRSAEWADDNNLLVIADDVLETGQVFRIDMEKGEMLKVSEFPADFYTRYGTVKLFPPYTYVNGHARLFISYFERGGSLHDIDLKTNSTSIQNTYDHPMDRFIPDAESDYFLMEEWNKDRYELTIYPHMKRKQEVILKGTDSDAVQIHPIAKIPNSDNLYVEVTGEDTARVHIYDLKERKLGPVVLKDDEYDVEATEIILPYTGEIVGFRYERDKPHAYYLDDGIKKIMASVDRALPGKFNLIESASSGREVFVIFSRGDRQPGEYYLYFASQKKLVQLLGRAEWMPEEKLSSMQPVHYTARDGLPVEAYFTVPNRPARDKPLIVLPHGGPHIRDKWGFDEWAQFFASRGYAVIQPNYRISTGYGQHFFDKGLKQVGYAIQDDILDAMKWAQSQGYGQKNNVCIVGGSFGGYAAMRAATTDPELFKCVIAIAGFYDIQKLLEADKNKSFYWSMKKIYGDPETDKDRLFEASPINALDKLKAPVLVVHGERDPRVDYKQATDLIEALKSKNKTFEALLCPDEGHSFYKASNRQKLFEAMEKFLGRYLLGTTESVAATPPAH